MYIYNVHKQAPALLQNMSQYQPSFLVIDFNRIMSFYIVSNADPSPQQAINSIQSCNYTILELPFIYMYLFSA